jgi:hypothetical protein
MTERLATCMCGQLSIRCRGEPVIVSMCHCLACQRRTGSIFGVTAFYDRANVAEATGRSTTFRRRSDAGRLIKSHFCPECGSTVYWEPEVFPERIGVAVGAFADPAFPQPVRAVWTENRHHWVAHPENMADISRQP